MLHPEDMNEGRFQGLLPLGHRKTIPFFVTAAKVLDPCISNLRIVYFRSFEATPLPSELAKATRATATDPDSFGF